ncbi:hypothetical protein BV25DRAFT_1290701 [Artomyces pyxidatus]|uniref:Uncharacterized protein n=1 Tax=Artomyces pyxidatus TaxID=48021 RepID=A0ACB8SP28_9AGAM|nr:hypothetical protein BV25DRAFT_1290701 [Artomyces pyxidatus]
MKLSCTVCGMEPDKYAGKDSIWSMYLSKVEKTDKDLAEDWKGNTDGILIFTGLFSATYGRCVRDRQLQELAARPEQRDNCSSLSTTCGCLQRHSPALSFPHRLQLQPYTVRCPHQRSMIPQSCPQHVLRPRCDTYPWGAPTLAHCPVSPRSPVSDAWQRSRVRLYGRAAFPHEWRIRRTSRPPPCLRRPLFGRLDRLSLLDQHHCYLCPPRFPGRQASAPPSTRQTPAPSSAFFPD